MSDVDKLARATKNSFDRVDERFDIVDERFDKTDKKITGIKKDMKAMESRLNKKINQSQKEIIYEFKALAENIHQDVAGANKDEISLIKQKQTILTKRITRVEHKVSA